MGFFLGGFPIVVVLRALSHVVFVSLGGLYLNKNKDLIHIQKSSLMFSFVIGIIHGICEVLIVIPFYFGLDLSQGYYDKGFLFAIVEVGTIIHSMLDLGLSIYIWNVLPKEFKKGSLKTQKA